MVISGVIFIVKQQCVSCEVKKMDSFGTFKNSLLTQKKKIHMEERRGCDNSQTLNLNQKYQYEFIKHFLKIKTHISRSLPTETS